MTQLIQLIDTLGVVLTPFKLTCIQRNLIMESQGLPFYADGQIISGFGRGSKELGIPTANYSEDVVNSLPDTVQPGVYYGWAQVDDGPVYKMVMSIGWNPYYNNTKKSMETHILHKFDGDLYGCNLKTILLEFLRPEKNFDSLGALTDEINNDIKVASNKLDEPEMLKYKSDSFFKEGKEKRRPFRRKCAREIEEARGDRERTYSLHNSRFILAVAAVVQPV